MAFVLWLEGRKMPAKAREIFHQAEKEQVLIYIPALVFAELGYLAEKNKIDTNLFEVRHALLKNKAIKEYPISFETINIAFQIDDIPELHDRIIASVAKELDAKIITNDPDIENSAHVNTMWK